MAHLRLIGLILLITTILLALAAAATKTTHIRVKRPGRVSPAGEKIDRSVPRFPAPEAVVPGGSIPRDPVPDDTEASQAAGAERTLDPAGTPQPSVEFAQVPILWPLTLSGALGLVLWFLPAPRRRRKPTRRRRRRRRK